MKGLKKYLIGIEGDVVTFGLIGASAGAFITQTWIGLFAVGIVGAVLGYALNRYAERD